MIVHSIKEAWAVADKLFPTDYIKNERLSQRSGYNVYSSTVENNVAHINDLGCRLEIIDEKYNVVNIWIEEPVLKDDEKSELYRYIDTFIYKIEDNFSDSKIRKTGLDNVIKELEIIVDKYING